MKNALYILFISLMACTSPSSKEEAPKTTIDSIIDTAPLDSIQNNEPLLNNELNIDSSTVNNTEDSLLLEAFYSKYEKLLVKQWACNPYGWNISIEAPKDSFFTVYDTTFYITFPKMGGTNKFTATKELLRPKSKDQPYLIQLMIVDEEKERVLFESSTSFIEYMRERGYDIQLEEEDEYGMKIFTFERKDLTNS